MLADRHRGRFEGTLRRLVRIPSRSSPEGGEEGAVQRVVAELMGQAGARVRTFEADGVPGFRTHPLCHGPERGYAGRPTVVGEIGPPEAPALLLVAHADTVQLDCVRPAVEWTVDPFAGLVRDGAMYGLGVGDDKWGLAAMLTVVQALGRPDRKPLRRLICASSIDEEHGVGNGMLLLMLAGVRAEAAIYLDGAEGRVTIGLLGGSNLCLRPGRTVAPARLEVHAAALAEAARALSAPRAALFDRPFFRDNPARLSSVRFQRRDDARGACFVMPFYTLPGESVDSIRAQLEGAVAGALGGEVACYNLTYREPWFEPVLLAPETPVARVLADAFSAVTRQEAAFSASTKQDSFVLNNHARIPTVSFGAARLQGPGAYHQPNECIDLDFAWCCCRVVYEAARRWLEDEAPWPAKS